MVSDFTKDIINKIRALYKSDPNAQQLFDNAAQRVRDARSISIDLMCRSLDISRGEAVALARRLQEAECGEFVLGRRGQKSRFEWAYSCISLGQAAAGEASDLEEAEDPLPEGEEEDVLPAVEAASISDVAVAPLLTISHAKELLSKSLGVPVASIEIIVRA